MDKNGLSPKHFQVLLLKSHSMKSKNFVQLMGYLGNDQEIHLTTTGKTLARLRLATTYFRKQEDGTKLKYATWHDIIAWNKLALQLPGNFIKGSHVLIEGEIQYRTFLDMKEHKRYVTEIRAYTILNLDR